MSDTFFNSHGQSLIASAKYGVWTLTADFSCQSSTMIGPTNRIPFDNVVTGTFPDFDTVTNKLTVTKSGIYAISWYGVLKTADSGVGIRRMSIINYTKVLGGIINNPAVVQHVTSGLIASFGLSVTIPLQKLTIMDFGLLHDSTVDLVFEKENTALRIALLSEF